MADPNAGEAEPGQELTGAFCASAWYHTRHWNGACSDVGPRDLSKDLLDLEHHALPGLAKFHRCARYVEPADRDRFAGPDSLGLPEPVPSFSAVVSGLT